MTLVEILRQDVFHGDARLANMAKHNPLHMEAADHIEALEASVVGLTQERDFHRHTADLHAERIARAADLIERLRRYAWHNRNCPVIYGATQDECLCGLTALIKEIEGE